MDSGHYQKAKQFREENGTDGLEQTLDKAVRVLHHAQIPHLVTGGYAAQQYGCLRYTDNIDLIVPNIARVLAVLLGNGFQPRHSKGLFAVHFEADVDCNHEISPCISICCAFLQEGYFRNFGEDVTSA
jgi:hypothetical protein